MIPREWLADIADADDLPVRVSRGEVMAAIDCEDVDVAHRWALSLAGRTIVTEEPMLMALLLRAHGVEAEVRGLPPRPAAPFFR